jgi:uncharacterized protein (DUF2236 family)
MSATLVGTIRGLFATCNVTAQVGPVLTNARGVTAVVRNGVGDYSLTLQDGINFLGDGGGIPMVQAYGATPALNAVEQVDPTHVRVRTVDAAGVALEANFGFTLQDIGPA